MTRQNTDNAERAKSMVKETQSVAAKNQQAMACMSDAIGMKMDG